MSLRAIRKARGLTQAQVAELCGVEQGTISRIEKGHDGVTVRMLRQVAGPLGVTAADLISEERAVSEALLIEAFRSLPPDRQMGWIDMAKIASRDASQVRE